MGVHPSLEEGGAPDSFFSLNNIMGSYTIIGFRAILTGRHEELIQCKEEENKIRWKNKKNLFLGQFRGHGRRSSSLAGMSQAAALIPVVEHSSGTCIRERRPTGSGGWWNTASRHACSESRPEKKKKQ